ncbi:hypothetical protein LE181_13610 [Streptomyces sp. SCA3-4]|uniref:hypothetical protein n=1 Tax=Streptomyces sichuanensis TaxID=2871810 RepID=UPI001CE241B3|nr:hypothetical protein [Streptomyces sichuanensis]MCA6093195.1 hypothetical protein [Streptomyces sichuanensis]
MRGEREEPRGVVSLTIGDCDTLRALAPVGSCKDGDVFVVAGAPGRYDEDARPGTELSLAKGAAQEKVRWTVPASARVVGPQDPRSTGRGMGGEDVLATPSAIDVRGVADASANVALRLDPSSPDAVERVRNVAAGIAPGGTAGRVTPATCRPGKGRRPWTAPLTQRAAASGGDAYRQLSQFLPQRVRELLELALTCRSRPHGQGDPA